MEGKSVPFYLSGLNSFENGLLLVSLLAGADCLDWLVIVRMYHRMFEEKTGAFLGGGG
jgi:hypothetical protein